MFCLGNFGFDILSQTRFLQNNKTIGCDELGGTARKFGIFGIDQLGRTLWATTEEHWELVGKAKLHRSRIYRSANPRPPSSNKRALLYLENKTRKPICDGFTDVKRKTRRQILQNNPNLTI